jgi:hypothetical protein
MRTGIVLSLAYWAGLCIGSVAQAQQTVEYETDANGVRYQVTRQFTQRSIPTTEYQTREQKVFRPQVTTDYQTYQQMYATPVTEYRMVSRMHGWWNPFAQPYWTHNLEPITRWETRPGTVQVPVARTDWVEEIRTAQVPVTTYRTVQDERVFRTAISAPPAGLQNGGTAVASRPASQQYESDPPRYKSPLTGAPQYGSSTVR